MPTGSPRSKRTSTKKKVAKEKAPALTAKQAAKAEAAAAKTAAKAQEKEAAAAAEEAAAMSVLWDTDEALCNAMLAAITDDDEIRQGLYKDPGGNSSTQDGGGQKKRHWHEKVANIIFAAHPKYKDAFALSTTLKAKQKWGEKVKNRLSRMEKLTRKYIAELGETGAGIERKEDIDWEKPNAFTNKFAQIDAAFPYFFAMRDLIAERPNIVPVGLGNSTTGFDPSKMKPRASVEPDNNEAPDPEDASHDGDDEEGADEEGDSDGSMPSRISGIMASKPLKRKANNDAPDGTRGPATAKTRSLDKDEASDVDEKPRIPTAAKGKGKKPKNVQMFEELAAAEETTRQRELELKTARVAMERQKIKTKALTKLDLESRKLEVLKLKMELKERESQRQHELQMMQLQVQSYGPAMSQPRFTPYGSPGLHSSDNFPATPLRTPSSRVSSSFTPYDNYGETSGWTSSNHAGASTSSNSRSVSAFIGADDMIASRVNSPSGYDVSNFKLDDASDVINTVYDFGEQSQKGQAGHE
ncbi:hypothetical protein FA95DRAFT_1613888 [Auriscalpium vulgare]|uniref:Uncharacterized protein n=1 Tax=Auriscalpium vulgare TaxID=40419 RepID=A0ACB8R1M3_9AGAM|nr:hypothetical protein FA95DRAFT_1613888 [Auriscalpium vulgare]